MVAFPSPKPALCPKTTKLKSRETSDKRHSASGGRLERLSQFPSQCCIWRTPDPAAAFRETVVPRGRLNSQVGHKSAQPVPSAGLEYVVAGGMPGTRPQSRTIMTRGKTFAWIALALVLAGPVAYVALMNHIF